jgi:hypothetical protein
MNRDYTGKTPPACAGRSVMAGGKPQGILIMNSKIGIEVHISAF